MTTQGKRHDLAEGEYALEMGEYGKDLKGHWFYRVPVPGFGTGGLDKHQITEHENGTITVQPSILCYGSFDKTWHGYLEKGVWREV